MTPISGLSDIQQTFITPIQILKIFQKSTQSVFKLSFNAFCLMNFKKD